MIEFVTTDRFSPSFEREAPMGFLDSLPALMSGLFEGAGFRVAGVLVHPLLLGAKDDGFAAWRRLLWYSSFPLIGILLVGAVVVACLKRWRKKSVSDKMSTGEQMTHFREMFERGEMNPEEYKRVHALLAERLKQELALAGPTSAALTPSDPPAPPPKG